MPWTSNRQLEIQVRHLGGMSVNSSQSWPIMRQACLALCCFTQDQEEVVDPNIGKKYLLKHKYFVSLNQPGVRHSNNLFVPEEIAMFHRQEQTPFLCSIVQVPGSSPRERMSCGLRMLFCQSDNGVTQRRNVNSLESHLKNRVSGLWYLLNCSAVQTKSCVNRDQDVFHVHSPN